MGSLGIDRVVSEPCNKRTILQRNYWQIAISQLFAYNSFVKFYSKKNLRATTCQCYIQICVIIRCAIKGVHSNYSLGLANQRQNANR